MPHLHLSLSPDHRADLARTLARLASVLADCETVDPASVKAYATVHAAFAPGAGHPPRFAHLEVKLLDGRSPELRASIADRLFATLREELPDGGLTLEMTEMERATYRKA